MTKQRNREQSLLVFTINFQAVCRKRVINDSAHHQSPSNSVAGESNQCVQGLASVSCRDSAPLFLCPVLATRWNISSFNNIRRSRTRSVCIHAIHDHPSPAESLCLKLYTVKARAFFLQIWCKAVEWDTKPSWRSHNKFFKRVFRLTLSNIVVKEDDYNWNAHDM